MRKYTGSGPGRLFRAWRYQHRHRLSVINYVAVLVGFLTIVTTLFMAYGAMAGDFFQNVVVIYVPWESVNDLGKDLQMNLMKDYQYRNARFHFLRIPYSSWGKLRGFTVRYFRDESGVDRIAKRLYEKTKELLLVYISNESAGSTGVLRGRLLKVPLAEAEKVISGVSHPPVGFGNFPRFRYEIWVGKDLIIPESEALNRQESDE